MSKPPADVKKDPEVEKVAEALDEAVKAESKADVLADKKLTRQVLKDVAAVSESEKPPKKVEAKEDMALQFRGIVKKIFGGKKSASPKSNLLGASAAQAVSRPDSDQSKKDEPAQSEAIKQLPPLVQEFEEAPKVEAALEDSEAETRQSMSLIKELEYEDLVLLDEPPQRFNTLSPTRTKDDMARKKAEAQAKELKRIIRDLKLYTRKADSSDEKIIRDLNTWTALVTGTLENASILKETLSAVNPNPPTTPSQLTKQNNRFKYLSAQIASLFSILENNVSDYKNNLIDLVQSIHQTHIDVEMRLEAAVRILCSDRVLKKSGMEQSVEQY